MVVDVVILSVINTADSVCVCVCSRERERATVERWSDREGCMHVCIDEGLLTYH